MSILTNGLGGKAFLTLGFGDWPGKVLDLIRPQIRTLKQKFKLLRSKQSGQIRGLKPAYRISGLKQNYQVKNLKTAGQIKWLQ
jgi:hypothetical protein